MKSKKQVSSGSGSCLIICLKGLGILILISLLFGFGWIAGIVWLLFFRKKSNDAPKKRQQKTVVISILSAFSFIFMIYTIVTQPQPEPIPIVSNNIDREQNIIQDYIPNNYSPELITADKPFELISDDSQNIEGRGRSDSGRSEPQYVGVTGYIVVNHDQEYDLERTDTFIETPWTIPTLTNENNTLNHKTEVVVKSQNLKHEGWGSYSGQLTVEITETKEECIIDVSNFITKPYWTYDDLTEASKIGYYIAEYHQISSDYPVNRDNKNVNLDDGMKILVVGSSGLLSGNAPDHNIYTVKAKVFKEWQYGYGGVDIFFNPQDLTLIY